MSSMSSFKKQLAEKKAAKTIPQRLDALEQGVASIVDQVNKRLQNLQQRGVEVEDVLKGIVDMLGPDKVTEAVIKVKNTEVEKEAAEKKNNVLKACGEGKLKVAEVVSANSVIIGTEVKPDGTVTIPKENVVGFMALNADLQALLLDKKVGESFEIPGTNGNVFTVLAVYDIVEEAVAAFQAEEAAAETVPEAPAPTAAV